MLSVCFTHCRTGSSDVIILVYGGGGGMCNSALCASARLSVFGGARLWLSWGGSSGEGREERLQDGLHSTWWHLTLFSSCKYKKKTTQGKKGNCY